MKATPRRQSRPLVAKDNIPIFVFSTPEQANKFCGTTINYFRKKDDSNG